MNAAAYHIQKYIAERTRIDALHSTDTSSDPLKFGIIVPCERLETAEVQRNTGKGWVFVGEFADRYAAQRWIDRQEEDE